MSKMGCLRMDRKSFVLYTSSKSLVDELDVEQSGMLFKSILEYVTNGEPLEMDLPTKIVFKSISEYLERDFKLYQTQCEVNRINGSKGGRPKGTTKKTENNRTVISKTERLFEKPKETQKNIDIDSDIDIDIDSDIKEIKGEKSRVKDKSKRRFEPPTVDEVQQYIKQQGYTVDAQQFVDYYATRGWEVSKGRKIKDWKACVRTWNTNAKTWNAPKTQGTGVIISEEQRIEYPTFDDLANAINE